MYPLLTLCVIGSNLRVEILRNSVKRNTVLRFDDEFLLQPKPLLKVFKLRKEIDDLLRDHADDFNLGEILFHTWCGFVFYIVQMHDLVLDEEVKLTVEKTAQVRMNEVIESVPSYVAAQMCVQAAVGQLAFCCNGVGSAKFRHPGNK